MKLSATFVALLAVPAAAFQIPGSSSSYLDSLAGNNHHHQAVVSEQQQPVQNYVEFSPVQEPPAVEQEENQGLPMIPQEPVLHALSELDDNMARIHDENMQALLEISSSFKKLAIRSNEDDMQEKHAEEEQKQQETFVEQKSQQEIPTSAFIGSGWR